MVKLRMNFDLDNLVKIAAIISGLATLLSAIYLKKQNNLSKKRVTISVVSNPLIWNSREKTSIKICNSSDFPILLDSYMVSNQLNRSTGELHEYAVELSDSDSKIFLTPNQTYDIELKTFDYPKNIPLSFEIRYKSSFDEFKELRKLDMKETRTIV